MFVLRRILIFIVLIVATWFGLTALHKHLDPNTHIAEEDRENSRWIASSPYWLDRNACRWLGICGLAHWHPDPPALSRRYRPHNDLRRGLEIESSDNDNFDPSWSYFDLGDTLQEDGRRRPAGFANDKRLLKEVPQFVLDAAPLIHLYSKEEFWPSDFGEHLLHNFPHANHTDLNITNHTLYNLHDLNAGVKGRWSFLQSESDVESRPTWLGSSYNKPEPYPEEEESEHDNLHLEFFEAKLSDEDKETWFDTSQFNQSNDGAELPWSFRAQPQDSGHRSRRKRRSSSPILPPNIPRPSPSGSSPAPVILIMVDKGHGILDAFWFYFYSYNLGTTVINIRFGNHIGDWEHSLIRFHHGVPKAVFFSAHSGGTAYTFNAVEKGKGPGREGRPVLYSAFGSHAMYAMPGKHPYVLPFGLLADVTDKGPLWDPALNYYAYHLETPPTHDQDAQSIESITLPSHHQSFLPASSNPSAPTSWFWYTGHWGDKFYELWDWRQWRFVGQYHYVNGPLGPIYKNLGRSKVCQSGLTCTMLDSIAAGKKASWIGRRVK